MLCIQEIYETYKKDVDKGRILLYKQILAIINYVLKTKNIFIDNLYIEDLKSTVFLKLDEKIIKGKGNILLRTFSTIQEFLAKNKLLFLKLPKNKLKSGYGYKRLDTDDFKQKYTLKTIENNISNIDYIKQYMNKYLTINENIIINIKYFNGKNKNKNINKMLMKRLHKTRDEIKKIEKNALNKLQKILNT